MDTASSLRVVADKSNHAREWYFKDQNEHSAISSTSEVRHISHRFLDIVSDALSYRRSICSSGSIAKTEISTRTGSQISLSGLNRLALHSLGRTARPFQGAKDDSTSQAITPPAEEAVPLHANRKEDGELDSKPPLKANAFPSTSYSSLISEIAGKYGCADPHEQHWSESDDGFESPGESSRKFLPPQWQSVRASFRSALNAALRTAEARTALQLHIESLQAVEKD